MTFTLRSNKRILPWKGSTAQSQSGLQEKTFPERENRNNALALKQTFLMMYTIQMFCNLLSILDLKI